jgi:hypothetical protein
VQDGLAPIAEGVSTARRAVSCEVALPIQRLLGQLEGCYHRGRGGEEEGEEEEEEEEEEGEEEEEEEEEEEGEEGEGEAAITCS